MREIADVALCAHNPWTCAHSVRRACFFVHVQGAQLHGLASPAGDVSDPSSPSGCVSHTVSHGALPCLEKKRSPFLERRHLRDVEFVL